LTWEVKSSGINLNSNNTIDSKKFKGCVCKNCNLKPVIRLKMPLIKRTGWFCDKHSKEITALNLAEKLIEGEE